VNDLGVYQLKPGKIGVLTGTGSATKSYALSTSHPSSRGEINFSRRNLGGALGMEYIEADFSVLFFNVLNVTDSIVITDGKLRYQ
jgi:hypothetical protein